MDNHWLDYLEKIKEAREAVRLAHLYAEEAIKNAREASRNARGASRIDNVKKLFDKKGE